MKNAQSKTAWVICRLSSGVLQILAHMNTQGPVWNTAKKATPRDRGHTLDMKIYFKKIDAEERIRQFKEHHQIKEVLSVKSLDELLDTFASLQEEVPETTTEVAGEIATAK